ncbi:MAG: hypothetical protein CM15mP18_1060 [Methanobacteriota archaeon]|nr:MAG: hypothetical protein CM15mP18_1060 [Euryarchaeota archaeon]
MWARGSGGDLEGRVLCVGAVGFFLIGRRPLVSPGGLLVSVHVSSYLKACKVTVVPLGWGGSMPPHAAGDGVRPTPEPKSLAQPNPCSSSPPLGLRALVVFRSAPCPFSEGGPPAVKAPVSRLSWPCG